jgi:hypothetical protein
MDQYLPTRNLFNADFTMMAAMRTSDDGGTHIGYVTLDGDFLDLTPDRGSEYGSKTPQQRLPVFSPKTGRIWYADDNSDTKFGSVDPEVGATSQREEPSQPGWGSDAPISVRFDFAADGTTLTTVGGNSSLLTPDGHDSVSYDVNYGLVNKGSGGLDKVGVFTFTGDAPYPHCWPKKFVDSTRFICVPLDGSNLVIIKLSDDRKTLSETPLLPESEISPTSEVANSDGSMLAFVGDNSSLYVVSTTQARSEPRKIAEATGTPRLVAWLG